MGTVVSLDLRGEGSHGAAIADVIAWLHEVDRRFSPYDTRSETSQHSRGEIEERDQSADLAEIIAFCDSMAAATGGAFSAWRDGAFDPSAYVKGWSGRKAAALLRSHGCSDWSINIGGDVLTSGAPAPGQLWRIGVQHPFDRSVLARVVYGSDLAVATSGSYERGAHIVDARTDRPALEAVSVTVTGPDLGYADAYSTATFSLGSAGPAWLAAIPEYESMTIWADGRITSTNRFPPSIHGVPFATVPHNTNLLGAA